MVNVKRWAIRIGGGAVAFVLARAVVGAIENAGVPVVDWTAQLLGGITNWTVLAWLIPGLIGLVTIFVWARLERRNEARQPAPTASPAKPDDGGFRPPSKLFQSDFSTLLKLSNEITATFSDGVAITYKQQIHQDYQSNTEFLSFFVPRSDRSYSLIEGLPTHYRSEYDKLKQGLAVTSKSPLDIVSHSSSDLAFTGRVYVYHEDSFALRQVADLIDIYKTAGLSLVLRGPDYATQAMLQWQLEKRS